MIMQRLEKGERFGALALAFSNDRASRDSSGDLGYFTNDMLDPVLTRKAFSADMGVVLAPFKTEAGWHVMEVLDRRRAPEPSFEDMQGDIMSRMTYDEIKKLLGDLRARAQIEYLTQISAQSSEIESTRRSD